MIEGEPGRVEEVPLGRKPGHTTSSAPSIRVIAHDRMADRRDMNADLVSPSGMEMGTKKVPRIEPSKAYEVGLGRPTLNDDCHALPVSRITRYRLVDSQLIRCQVTPRHNRVPPGDPSGGDGGAQKPMGAICFGDDQEAGRFLVEAVHYPGTLGFLALVRQAPASANQRVDERSRPVARSWMHYHAGRLVHHQQRLVLVDDRDRDVLAKDLALLYARVVDAHNFATQGLVARPFTAPVDKYVAVGDEGGRLSPRQIRLLGYKQIEADIAVRPDGKLSNVAQGLALRWRVRYRCCSNNWRWRPLFTPQYPGEEKRPDAHRHVGHVKGRPAQITDANVDEIDNSRR